MKKLCALLLALLTVLAVLPAAAAQEPTEEDLFAGYVRQTFYPEEAALLSVGENAAGAKLTRDEKLAYDALVPIIKKIASGERTSTSITLGHPSRPIDAEVSFSYDRIFVKKDFDLSAIIRALLTDFPYEFYWYDKTPNGGVPCSYSALGSRVWVTFNFCVAQDYAADSFQTNVTKTSATIKAVANAKAIVEKHKGKNDYEKLKAYKDEICELTNYNDDAADNESTPYGDPWQMIYVFDNDPSTHVVCEGYSKAFQYLCDSSTFDANIACYSVSGVSSGEDGSGGHMWNIVTMNDGKHYLVDVTNSDPTLNKPGWHAIGYNGELFLTGVQKRQDGWYIFPIGSSYLAYKYYPETEALWGNTGILDIASSKYSYTPTVHTHRWSNTVSPVWAEDHSSCSFVKACAGCSETQTVCTTTNISWNVKNNTLILTATGKKDGKPYFATTQFRQENDTLTLPKAQEGSELLAASYKNGRLISIQPCSATTLQLSSLPGSTVKVFILNSDSHAPLFPCLLAGK